MRRRSGALLALILPLALAGCVRAFTDDGAADGSPGADGPRADGPPGRDAAPLPDSAPDGLTKSCTSTADCDDGRTCTEEQCVAGKCLYTLKMATCLIGGVCYAGGQSGSDPCKICNPGQSTGSFSYLNIPKCFKVTTAAGSGQPGFKDGPALGAQLNQPMGLALDSAGKLYIADSTNNRIRVLVGGQLTTLAGDGVAGVADGPAAAARFNQPVALCYHEQQKTLYVADAGNHRIRAVKGGLVSTVAGTGMTGEADGPPLQAMFNTPMGLALTTGGLVVADNNNNRLRLITPGSGVSTLAGGMPGFADGAAAQAKFKLPTGLAALPSGTILIADTLNHRIRLLSKGYVSTMAGTGAEGAQDGPVSTATFSAPMALAPLANGMAVVADNASHRIRLVLTAVGAVFTLAGGAQGFSDGTGDKARFYAPRGIAVFGDKIYVADTKNHRIRLIQR